MKRIISMLCLLALVPLCVFFAGCEQEPEDPMEEIVEIWKAMYGEEYVVKMPESGLYCRVCPPRDEEINPFSDFRFFPLYKENPLYRENLAPADYKIIRCYPDKASYKVGENITITLENNSSDSVEVGWGNNFTLEFLSGGEWYPLNYEWSVAATSVMLSAGKAHAWIINENTFAISHYNYDPESNTYSYDWETKVPFELPAGRYRFVKGGFGSKEVEYHSVQCEFEIK